MPQPLPQKSPTFVSSLQRQLASLQETLLLSHAQVLADLQQQNLELLQENELLRKAPLPLPLPLAARGPGTPKTDEPLLRGNAKMFVFKKDGIDCHVADTPAVEHWTLLVGALINPDRIKPQFVPEEQSRYRMYEEWTVLARSKSRASGKARLNNWEDGVGRRTGDVMRDDTSCLQPFISTPFCASRLCWGVLGVFYLMWDILTIPLMAFDMPSELADPIGVMSYFSFAYWAFDMPSQFFIGFESKGGVLEMRPRVIARTYMTSWMVPDMSILALDVLIFSMDLIFEGTGSSNPLMTLRLARMLRLLRFVRLLRLRKLTDVMNIITARLRSEYFVLMTKFCRLTAMILIVNHYVACFWFLIGTMSENDETWIKSARIEHEGMGTQYLTAFHWSLTQFCPATNNIGPANGMERGFAIVLVLYAFIVFSSFVSAITNASNQLRAVKMDRIRQEDMIRQFIGEKQVSTDLWCRIQAFVMSRGLNTRVIIKESDIPLFLEIPESMRLQLHIELYMPMLASAPWMVAGASLDNEVLEKLVHNVIDERSVQARADVFVPGSDCSYCYFTRSGSMMYYSDLSDSAALHLQKDQWLAEVVLWSHWKHSGLLVTQTFTEFILIDADKFVRVVSQEGGRIYTYLRMLGLALLAQMDASDEIGEFCTDLGMGQKSMNRLAEHSRSFAELESKSRHTLSGMLAADLYEDFRTA